MEKDALLERTHHRISDGHESRMRRCAFARAYARGISATLRDPSTVYYRVPAKQVRENAIDF